MSEEDKMNFVLNEDELDVVSGGSTQNRYEPQKCNQYKEVAYDCVGFLSVVWCDHYRKDYLRQEGNLTVYEHKCVMGCFCYEEKKDERDAPGQMYG